ncbi:MAG TPA: TadE family protein [Bryobacteraceae bacterium]|nr:TadE family protein [Bryobacteraceae bacterium]
MRRRGNAIIEFALSFGLLFSVFAGVFQFGYAFVVYNNLQTAVRAGARYASLRVYDSSTSTPSAAYLAAVRNVVIYGDPSGSGPRRVPGLTPEQVQVTIIMDRNVPRDVSVAIVGYTLDAAVRSFTLNGKPKATMPYMGRFAPDMGG